MNRSALHEQSRLEGLVELSGRRIDTRDQRGIENVVRCVALERADANEHLRARTSLRRDQLEVTAAQHEQRDREEGEESASHLDLW